VIRGLDGICPTMGSGRAPGYKPKDRKGITSGDGCQAIMTEDCRDFKIVNSRYCLLRYIR
jgi:hypothetical protein